MKQSYHWTTIVFVSLVLLAAVVDAAIKGAVVAVAVLLVFVYFLGQVAYEQLRGRRREGL